MADSSSKDKTPLIATKWPDSLSVPPVERLEIQSPQTDKPRLWIHRIPVWKEFGPWLKWASAFATAATIATGFGEYALALGLLLFCLACSIVQIFVWTTERGRILKWLLAIMTVGLTSYGVMIVMDQKGDKRWGVFWPKTSASPPGQKQQVLTSAPVAFPVPTISPSAPVATPTVSNSEPTHLAAPKPVAKKDSKARELQEQRRIDQALRSTPTPRP